MTRLLLACNSPDEDCSRADLAWAACSRPTATVACSSSRGSGLCRRLSHSYGSGVGGVEVALGVGVGLGLGVGVVAVMWVLVGASHLDGG